MTSTNYGTSDFSRFDIEDRDYDVSSGDVSQADVESDKPVFRRHVADWR